MSGEFPEDWFRPVEPPETSSAAQEPAEGGAADAADVDPAAFGVGEGHGGDPAVALEMDLSLPDDQSADSTPETHRDLAPQDSVAVDVTPAGATPGDATPDSSAPGESDRQAAVGEQPADPIDTSSGSSSKEQTVTPAQGTGHTEATEDGSTPSGSTPNGAPPSGATPNGAPPSGATPNGAPPSGATPNGAPPSGATPNGAPPSGATPSGSTDGRRGVIPPTGPEPGVIPVIASPGSLVVGKVEGDEEYRPVGTRLHPVGLAVVAIVLSLAVGLSLGLMILNQAAPSEDPTPSPSVVVSSVSATPAQQPYTGSISQLPIASVTSSCTAKQSEDGVRYPATAVSDNNPETAWRCNGDGVGQTLTLTVDHQFQLAAVGIVNGYAKNNGSISYYKQFRRIIRVTWTLPDGSYFVQYLSDNTTSVQRVMIPLTTVDGPITVRIDASSAPGDPATNRDAVLISTIQLWTVAG